MERKVGQHAFPTAAVMIALTIGAVVSGAIAFAIVAWAVDVATAMSTATFATLVVWTTAVLATIPVAIVGSRSASAAIFAYLAGMIGRILLCLAAALVGVELMQLPATPALLSMVAIYMVLLLIDVAMVGRYLTGKDSITAPEADSSLGNGADVEVTA